MRLMTKEEARKLAERKGFEVAYILFRVAENVKNKQFSGYLEAKAIDLLNEAISGSERAVETERILENMVRLGADLGFIHKPSSEVIIGEMKKINSAIAELSGNDTFSLEKEIGNVFKKEEKKAKSIRQENPAIHAHPINNRIIKEEISEEDITSPAQAYMRQSAILEKIRQLQDSPDPARPVYPPSAAPQATRAGGRPAGCRMKDIQEAFPATSERTIRYDLGKLTEQGLIERTGGGAGTSYRVKSTKAIQVVDKNEVVDKAEDM